MTCGPAPGIANVIVSSVPVLALAAVIAARREPVPAFAVVVTTNGLNWLETVVVCVAVLLAGFVSFWSAEATAVLVICPAVVGVTGKRHRGALLDEERAEGTVDRSRCDRARALTGILPTRT